MKVNEDFILELLMENGVLDQESAQQVVDVANENGVSVASATEALEIMSVEDVYMLLAAEYDLETVKLTEFKIPRELIKLVPKDIAVRYHVVPVEQSEGSITVAMSDPTDVQMFDALSHLLECDVQGVISTPEEIEVAIKKFYSDDLDVNFDEEVEEAEATVTFNNMVEEETDIDETPIVQLVSLLIIKAYQSKVSDIHIEPMEGTLRVRFRKDGMLEEMDSPPKALQNNIISRIKIMARLDITEKRLPQDGRISMRMKDIDLDLRVSTIPTTYGESIVMRLLDKTNVKISISELGMFSDDQENIEKIIQSPDGIFLVTGPTGSGKTTSLYAFLNTLNVPDRKIITAEDPIEYDLQGINQCQVNTLVGMSFAKILRSMLRQAPNIIMVGEIRDLETASIAIQASLTGHMVFSTLHTNDSTSAVARLCDIGVQPFLIASALKATMAQRLVRTICEHCKEPYKPSQEELEFLEITTSKESGSILLVEDDIATQKLIKKILMRNDYKVQTANNGVEALEIINDSEKPPVDIVISDFKMPKMDGKELTSRLNDDHPHIPVVIMSGAEQDELDEITELAIKGCLLKPVNSLHLLNTLQRIYAKVLKRKSDSSGDLDEENLKWAKGAGCAYCKGTGYSGRVGIYEIFNINPEIQEMIYKNEPASALRARARGIGMRTLRDDGIRKAAAGLTTIEEVVRVTMENEQEQYN